MSPKERQEIILLLICDDLTNTKLVDGLCNIGFHAESFYLNTSSVVFRLIGIDLDNPDNEPIYKEYIRRCSIVVHNKTIDTYSTLNKRARELYSFLLSAKNG